MNEVWKRISIFPAYEVSNTGKVRKGDRLLIIGKTQDGYPRVTMRDTNNSWHHKTVHTIVCEVFNGPKPSESHEVCHVDGTKANNKPSNLRWGTRKENVADSIKHGTFIYGEKQGLSTLSNKQVLEIKKKHSEGIRQYILAKQYGVSPQHISRIIKGMRRAKDHLSPLSPDESAK